MTISLWPPGPCMVEISRTLSQPGAGRSTMNAVLAPRAPSGTSSSVRAMRMANEARAAPEMNHLCPLITHSSPSCTTWVRMNVGSEPATSGSVMAKQDETTPSHSGFRYDAFWSSVPQCNSVCMLPSSGAMQLSTHGPTRAFAASACTMASATCPRPMPPHSGGMCGSQSPRSRARSRSASRSATYRRRTSRSMSSLGP